MESGTPGRKSTTDGWMNRALAPTKTPSPVRAVSLGTTLARSLRGSNDALALKNVDDFKVRGSAQDFEQMYAQAGDALSSAGRETFEAVKLLDSIRKDALHTVRWGRVSANATRPEPQTDRPPDQERRWTRGCFRRHGRMGHPRE